MHDLSMTQFLVDPNRIHDGNAQIQATIARLQQEITALQAQLLAMQDSWQGLASNSFQELFQRWKVTSDLVESQLGQLGQALAMAANQYSETESANQRLFL